MKVSTARSPFPWFGGKQKLADRLIEMFPPHRVYCEVFGGGASVLLSKQPATLDIYNDAEDGLVNFFRMLRDRPGDLVPLLELTPYSRTEFLDCVETWRSVDDEVERARRFYVCVSQAFGGFVFNDGTKTRGWGGERLGRTHLCRAASTKNRVDNIWRFVDRLRSVQIDNLQWRACLERYDSPETLFYLDPPYVPETRRSGRYSHELTAEDHAELVDRVLALEGTAIVSGYDSPLYEPLVTGGGFMRHEFGVWATASQRSVDTARDRRLEVVWASPRAAQPTLFNHAEATA